MALEKFIILSDINPLIAYTKIDLYEDRTRINSSKENGPTIGRTGHINLIIFVW